MLNSCNASPILFYCEYSNRPVSKCHHNLRKRLWYLQVDKEEYVKKLETESKKVKLQLQKQIDKIVKQIYILKARKRKYINMLADGQISHEDYRENVEVNNAEITELTKKKDDLLTSMNDEQIVDNIGKLKQELLSFLNFDVLTTEILHRLIDSVEVNEDGSLRIHYRFSAPPIK